MSGLCERSTRPGPRKWVLSWSLPVSCPHRSWYPWARTRALLNRSYFPAASDAGAEGGAEGTGDDEGVDIDWQLVASFLKKHRDTINVLDVDECASSEEAEGRLRVLAASALESPLPTLAR